MRRLNDPEMVKILLEAPVPKRATSRTTFDEDTVIVGIDFEWDAQREDKPLLSLQLCGAQGENLVSRCYDPPGPRLTPDVLVEFVLRFLAENVIELPVVLRGRGKKRKKVVKIVLLAHFAAAEISMIQDHFRDVVIRPIGQKAHHGELPSIVREDISYKVHIVDTFAFFSVALAKLGDAVGLPKIDVGSRADLARLKADNRELFEKYACRDAEIVLKMYRRFRTFIWDRYEIDVASKLSLAGVACSIFLRHYLTSIPAPAVEKNIVVPARDSKGEWREQVRRRLIYSGPSDRRLAAADAYHGGRAEAHVFGLVQGDLVELDVRSLYPSATQLQPLPNANTRWRRLTGRIDERALAGVEGFGSVKFMFPPGTPYPCLPVVQPKSLRMLFTLQGQSNCTVAEMREALRLGAVLDEACLFVFEPGRSEREHDLRRYMQDLMAEKAMHPKGTPEYETAKLLMNGLVGKLAERQQDDFLLEFEQEAASCGFSGAGKILAHAVKLRDSLRGGMAVGSMFMPEQACLILGKARALMAPIVARGVYLVSTDSVIVDRGTVMDCSAIADLRTVESDLTREREADALLVFRTRLYFLLQRVENLPLAAEPYAKDEMWAVLKVARHGIPVEKYALAATVLASLRAGKLVETPLPRKQLLSARSAVRMGRELNDEVYSERVPKMEWDEKRIRADSRVNPWVTWTETRPATTAGRLTAAQEHGAKLNAARARKRREEAAGKRKQVFEMLRAGASIREISKATGVAKSTVGDLKRKLNTHFDAFLEKQGIEVADEEAKS